MGRVIARVRAGVGSAPRVGRSARRCHSPGSGGANRLESSAGAMLGIPLSRRHVGGLLLAGPAGTIVGRSNTVSSGPLAWVMIHRHHAAERTGLGLDQNAWVSFGKQGWVNSRECRRNRRSQRGSACPRGRLTMLLSRRVIKFDIGALVIGCSDLTATTSEVPLLPPRSYGEGFPAC
jgi:hypothetical protein